MARDEHVIHVLAGIKAVGIGTIDHGGEAMENLDARLLQFHAHEHRQQSANEARNDGKPQVHRPNVLVVGGIDITPPTRRVGMVIIKMGVCGGH